MSDWVWLDHPDTEAGPQRFPNDPDVVAVQEARGWEQVDEPGASPEQGEVSPDEVDDRGQGWALLSHPDTGGTARVPVEGASAFLSEGWQQQSAAAALDDKSKADLQAEAKEKGLPVSGTKDELKERLREAEETPTPVEPETEE